MTQLPPAIDGTEQRLDVVIGELRALIADVETLIQSRERPEPITTEVVLQEPKKPAKKKRS
jgi:hypothetical protein